MNTVKRVLIIDSQPIIRAGFLHYLQALPSMEVCGEADTPEQALQKTRSLQPNIILLGLNLPDPQFQELIKNLRAQYDGGKIICLSVKLSGARIRGAIQAGAMAYIHKSAERDEMLEAIQSVVNGISYYSAEAARAALEDFSQTPTDSPARNATPFTRRENEVFQLIVKDMTNQEIADALFISPRTVEVHKRNLLEKTGSKHLAGLIMYAIRNGLLAE